MSGEPLDTLSPEAIKFCRSVGSQATTVTEIVGQHDPRVFAAIQRGIDAANQEADSGTHRIQKWIILEKDFSIRGGELGEWPESQWPWHWEAGPWLMSRATWALRSRALFWGSEGLRRQPGIGRGTLPPPAAWCPALPKHVHVDTHNVHSPPSLLGQPLRPGTKAKLLTTALWLPLLQPLLSLSPPRQGKATHPGSGPQPQPWEPVAWSRTGLVALHSSTTERVSPSSTGPTTKMKRYFITQKYRKQIENLYQ